MLVRLPLLTSHKWRELVPSGRLVCRCHDVFLWCCLCFVLPRFCLYAFVEAAVLRSIVLRYAGVPFATYMCIVFFLFVYLEMSPFPSIFCTIAVFSLNGKYVVLLLFRMVFFYIGTTGWIFDISLCENSTINQSNKRLVLVHTRASISVRIASNHYHAEKTYNARLISCTPVVLQVLSTSRSAMCHSKGRQCSLTTRQNMEVRR